jgi:hypothetical protein
MPAGWKAVEYGDAKFAVPAFLPISTPDEFAFACDDNRSGIYLAPADEWKGPGMYDCPPAAGPPDETIDLIDVSPPNPDQPVGPKTHLVVNGLSVVESTPDGEVDVVFRSLRIEMVFANHATTLVGAIIRTVQRKP